VICLSESDDFPRLRDAVPTREQPQSGSNIFWVSVVVLIGTSVFWLPFVVIMLVISVSVG